MVVSAHFDSLKGILENSAVNLKPQALDGKRKRGACQSGRMNANGSSPESAL